MKNFRNKNNALLTQGLFWENCYTDKDSAVYTLKDEDYKGCPSLYRLYIETGDLTEYEFATKHLDGWEHWLLLQKCTWFQPYLARWREELFVSIQSKELRRVQEHAKAGNITSSKYLLERGWEPKNTKGRPTKDQIHKEATRQANLQTEFNEDYDRVLGKDLN